ncbi:MAG: hypothetical protein ACRDUY_00435, partial [Nitriliruptorales bacterium]
AGAYVVLVDGQVACELERGGRSLVTFPAARDADAWLDGLASVVKDGRLRKIELQRIDGEDAPASDLRDRLLAAGFVDTPRGLSLRA